MAKRFSSSWKMNLKLSIITFVTLSIIFYFRLSYSYECEYQNNDQFIMQGQIDAVRVINKTVIPYIDDTRKCIMKIESKIKKKWYPSTGHYIFGPDMSESEACNHAEQRAKKNIMRQRVQEKLKSQSHLKCLNKDYYWDGDVLKLSEKESCNIIYMNVRMENEGIQKVKMRLCPK